MISLKTSLLPYQVPAYEKLRKIKVAALYLEMGLGKTRTAIELIKNRYDRGKINYVLWLCPCSVKTNLERDIKKHSKGLLDITSIIGIESISMSDRTYLMALDIVMKHDCYLIIDESNLVKNYFAKRTQRITELGRKCSYKMILNGTPITKNEADLYSQWYIMDHRIFGYRTFWSFAANHLEYDKYGKVCRVLNADYLTNKIAPYSYQIKKSEILTELPIKCYSKFYFSLTDEQNEHYFCVRDIMLASVDDFDSTTIYRLLTALQLITSGRKIIDTEDHLKHKPFFDNPEDNPRIKALINIIGSTDEKYIIWCKYTFEIEEINHVLQSMNKKTSLFYGGIPLKKRYSEIDKFNKDAQFFLAIKASGGYGLNLQHICNNMIYYSNDFDWGTRAQSEDRVHRIGQTNTVFIMDIIADNKIDEKIMKNLKNKGDLNSYISYLLNNKKHISEIIEGCEELD